MVILENLPGARRKKTHHRQFPTMFDFPRLRTTLAVLVVHNGPYGPHYLYL